MTALGSRVEFERYIELETDLRQKDIETSTLRTLKTLAKKRQLMLRIRFCIDNAELSGLELLAKMYEERISITSGYLIKISSRRNNSIDGPSCWLDNTIFAATCSPVIGRKRRSQGKTHRTGINQLPIFSPKRKSVR
jgi:hypothetical protein